jgi:diguanylate cyclase (GGDEF)-like protein
MLSTIYATHAVGADATRVLIAAQAIVTLPWALFLLALRRRHDPKGREVMLVGGYGLVTLGAIALDQHMANDAALYFAFASALIPVFGNIVAPISFVGAAIGSVASVAALIVSALWRQRFSAGAEFAMIVLYGGGAAATLVANYRFESYERLNYLIRLIKTLRNDDPAHGAERIAHLPRAEFLSALPNRHEFDERFTAAANWCRSENLALSALFVDIDNFRLYNDRHGRLEGDKCLEAVAQAIVNAIDGSGGFAGRVGGGAFAVVLPGADNRVANAIAEQIRAAVLASRLPHLGFGERRFVTVSVGAATMSAKKPETTNSLLARADEALYRAKRGGRDRTEIERRVVNG